MDTVSGSEDRDKLYRLGPNEIISLRNVDLSKKQNDG
jgi:hypothetical protein